MTERMEFVDLPEEIRNNLTFNNGGWQLKSNIRLTLPMVNAIRGEVWKRQNVIEAPIIPYYKENND